MFFIRAVPKILQGFQGNACAGVTFLAKFKAKGCRPATLSEKLQQRCFPLNFAKFFESAFLKTASELLPQSMKIVGKLMIGFANELKISCSDKNIALNNENITENFNEENKTSVLSLPLNLFRIGLCGAAHGYSRPS